MKVNSPKIFIMLLISHSFANILSPSKNYLKKSKQFFPPPRQLFSPVFDSIARNDYLNYMGTYGGNPWSFTPYASLYKNPFSNPQVAQNFPAAMEKLPYGKNMLNYMAFNNPLLYIPTGYGNPWNMGQFGIGSGHKLDTSKVDSYEQAMKEILNKEY